jgi:alpha-N-arabinofuranosidase
MSRKSATVTVVLTITLTFLSVGFSGAEEKLQGQISVSPAEKSGEISPDIYGLFSATVFHHYDQGMWAEMLKDRKFAEPDRQEGDYGVVRKWFSIGRNEKTYFMHDNTIYYSGTQSQKIISESPANTRTGIGQAGLCLKKDRGYDVRLNLKQQSIKTPVVVTMEDDSGVYAKEEITIPDTDWNRFEFKLKPAQSDKNGKFTITFSGEGTLWVGTASVLPDDNLSGFRRDVVEALKEIRPPNIRWPGGCNVDCWRWKQAIGDADRRPAVFDKAFKKEDEWIPNDVGIDEFMELCRLLGAKPYMVVNAGDGTAQEAADWVEYCNGSTDTEYGKLRAENGHPEPYNVKLWNIGNELFGNWEPGHVDEETYAKKCVDFSKAMRIVDKDIKIVACGGRYWKYPGWNKAIFKIAGDKIDYLSLHSYAKKYRNWLKKKDLEDKKLAEELYWYLVSSPYGVEEQIYETDKEIRSALPDRADVTIAFDEWNAFYYREPKEEIDFALRDGLYAAGMFHAFRRQHKAVTIADIWGPVNANPMIRVNQCGLFFNPQYLIFKMYADHSGPILVRTDVKCETYPAPEYEKGRPQAIGNIPYLDASATMSEDGKTLYLAIINRHISDDIAAKVSVDKWPFVPDVKLVELYDDDYMTENTFENPDRLKINESTVNIAQNPFNYTFKKHSVTILQFQKTE